MGALALELEAWTLVSQGARFILIYPVLAISLRLFGVGPASLATIFMLLASVLGTWNANGPSGLVALQFAIFSVFSGILIWLHKNGQDTEHALRESEGRLKEAHRLANLAGWSLNLLTGETWWSDGAFPMYGLNKAEVKASHELFMQSVHLADRDTFHKVFERTLATGCADHVFRIVRPSGEVRYVRGLATVSYDQNKRPVFISGTNQDVTESALNQIALQERERQLSAIYTTVASILFYIRVEPGNQFRFVSVNQEFLKSTGLTEEQVVGKVVQDVIPPQSVNLVLEKYIESVESKTSIHWEEVSTFPSGTKTGEVTVTPLLGERGEVTHLIGVVHDVTERRKLEDDLRHAIDVRDEFISIASHELKTPLTALYLQIQLMQKLGKVETSEFRDKISALVHGALRSVRSLNMLLNDLLDVTRIRVGKMNLEFKDIDLRVVIESCISSEQEAIKASGSSVAVSCEQSVFGRWDPTRIDQIICNLLSNALKYGRGQPIEITLTMDRATQSAQIKFRDQGIGIPAELQDKIFERFQRAAADNKITGLGLGLYIVRQIVEAHSGSIQVESKPNQGSLFIVTLPTNLSEPAKDSQ